MGNDIDLRKLSGLLADEERFRIAAAVSLGASTLEKIAGMTGYDNTRVMKAIVKLEDAGIIQKKESKGYVFNYDILHGITKKLSADMPPKVQSAGLDRFMKNGKLITYPSKPDDQLLVLEHIAELFEYYHPYPEKEVNEKLKTVNPDFAGLRRYLFDKGFFSRERVTEKDGHTTTMYWRVKHL